MQSGIDVYIDGSEILLLTGICLRF